jgi:lipopolysaccharide transport system permease protein
MTMAAGFLCARYRDLPNIVASFVQILFFITPVVWQGERIHNPTVRFVLTELNPFASLLAVVRDPILGTVPSMAQYGFSFGFALFGCAVTYWLFTRSNKRVVYWL